MPLHLQGTVLPEACDRVYRLKDEELLMIRKMISLCGLFRNTLLSCGWSLSMYGNCFPL